MSKVYLVQYSEYSSGGYIEKIASNKQAIKTIIKEDDLVVKGKGIIDIDIDFNTGLIVYTYLDYGNDEVENTLYLKTLRLV